MMLPMVERDLGGVGICEGKASIKWLRFFLQLSQHSEQARRARTHQNIGLLDSCAAHGVILSQVGNDRFTYDQYPCARVWHCHHHMSPCIQVALLPLLVHKVLHACMCQSCFAQLQG